MQRLDECLKLARKIREIDEQIVEIKTRAMSPKSQIITGMPKGSGFLGSCTDEYIAKLERLEAEKKRRVKERSLLWTETVDILLKENVHHEHIQLLKYRFFCGLPWKQCCTLMCKNYADSGYNINKIFRVYRAILQKFRGF